MTAGRWAVPIIVSAYGAMGLEGPLSEHAGTVTARLAKSSSRATVLAA